jgi:uncharacterized protein (TIGR04551 family)
MIRLLAAATAAQLLLAGSAHAQTTKDAAPAAPTPAAPAAAPATPAATDTLDPKTRALIQQEVDRAKEEIRNEVRAEMQGQQAATEFLGAVGEGPKLEFFELDGYLRFRGELYDDFGLGQPRDNAGYFLFPQSDTFAPIKGKGTIAYGDMRFRLEPTLNVSEYVRVKAQIDIFDNYVYGSSTGPLYDYPGSPYAVPFNASSRVTEPSGAREAWSAIVPKRAWAEVQTPVGVLAFGRMPSEWGLGILANAGGGIESDLGDTVDRILFAIAPVSTPIGKLAFVPMLDFDAEGVLRYDQATGTPSQPIDLSQTDDARTWSLKIARIDTEDEIRRKLERNEASLNFGAYYAYRTQKWWSPYWYQAPDATNDPYLTANWVDQNTNMNYVDVWFRYRTGRLRIELEGTGVFGDIGNPSTQTTDLGAALSDAFPKLSVAQWGGVLVADVVAIPSKLSFAGEFGIASGDDAPGFGNRPYRLPANQTGVLPGYGALEGIQWGGGDTSINNFRFNPAYRIDLILWRQILGQVTDAWYARPSIRWTILPGLVLDGVVVYSQALYAQSTVSATQTEPTTRGTYTGTGHTPLGVEFDAKLSFDSGTGFVAWLTYGLLQPFSGMQVHQYNVSEPVALSRANAFELGMAVKF